jgi:hypothetical protein
MEESLQLLKRYTKHEHIILTERGNIAIFAALQCARELGKKKVLIPDMGGWFTYKKYPKELGIEVEHIKTKDALIDIDYLSQIVDKDSVLLYANPGAYIVNQPITDIYKICSEKKCLVIMDVSGCISDPKMCDGNYADMMLGSFGEWKIVKAGYGGFLSIHKNISFETIKKYFDVLDFLQERVPDVKFALKKAPQRLKELRSLSQRVKEELDGFEIIHPDGKGIGVIVAYHTDEEKKTLLDYGAGKGYETVLCPKYIKVKRKAVSIEVKRM